jgi:hypothetical protein
MDIYEVLTAVLLKIQSIWYITQSRLVSSYLLPLGFSELSVTVYESTRHNIPEDLTLEWLYRNYTWYGGDATENLQKNLVIPVTVMWCAGNAVTQFQKNSVVEL